MVCVSQDLGLEQGRSEVHSVCVASRLHRTVLESGGNMTEAKQEGVEWLTKHAELIPRMETRGSDG